MCWVLDLFIYLYSERVGLLPRHYVGIGFEPHRSGREQEQPHTGKDAKVPTTGTSRHPEEEEEVFTQPDLPVASRSTWEAAWSTTGSSQGLASAMP